MLSDSQARKFSYLRLSLTEACNFSCRYCLPQGYAPRDPSLPEELSGHEVRNLLLGFELAGFSKVRFTGGEPTLRRDLPELLAFAASRPGFRMRALTTNGWNLRREAKTYRLAGLQAINVSVDSLDRDRFRELTGRDRLSEVLDGVENCLTLGFDAVKLNAVLHREYARDELRLFLEYVKSRPVTLRFIELMRTGNGSAYRDENHLSSGEMRWELLKQGWQPVERARDAGPAFELEHPDYRGRIGLIAPHAEGFCASCNRLRVSSTGALRLCLFGEGNHDLRPWIQTPEGARGLPERLATLLRLKAPSHRLNEGISGDLSGFSVIGG